MSVLRRHTRTSMSSTGTRCRPPPTGPPFSCCGRRSSTTTCSRRSTSSCSPLPSSDARRSRSPCSTSRSTSEWTTSCGFVLPRNRGPSIASTASLAIDRHQPERKSSVMKDVYRENLDRLDERYDMHLSAAVGARAHLVLPAAAPARSAAHSTGARSVRVRDARRTCGADCCSGKSSSEEAPGPRSTDSVASEHRTARRGAGPAARLDPHAVVQPGGVACREPALGRVPDLPEHRAHRDGRRFNRRQRRHPPRGRRLRALAQRARPRPVPRHQQGV